MARFRKTTVMAALLAMALLGLGVNSAHATAVFSDAGATGDFMLTSTGGVGGTVTITFMPPGSGSITEQNGINISAFPNTAAFSPITLTIMSFSGTSVFFEP